MMRILQGAVLSALALTLASPSQAAEVHLRAVTFNPSTDTSIAPVFMFFDRVNKAGKGLVHIDYVGGPETVPTFQLANSVKTGVVDIGVEPTTLLKGELFEIDAMELSPLTYGEARKHGAVDYINKLLAEKGGVHLLTSYGDNIPLHLYLRRAAPKANGKIDLKGFTMRSAPIYEAFQRSLGARTVAIAPADMHTALERGVIDGYAFPALSLQTVGLQELTKFRVDPGFYKVAVSFIVSPAKWKSLDAAQKKVINDAVAWFEDFEPKWGKKAAEDAYAEQAKAGIKAIEAQPDLGKEAADLYWAELEKKSPKRIAELRKMLTP